MGGAGTGGAGRGGAGTGGAGTGGSAGSAGSAGSGTCGVFSMSCDLYGNMGCPIGHKCAMAATAGQTICECAGTPRHGEPCTTTATGDTCAAGAVCLEDHKCWKFCRDSGDCISATPTGGICDLQLSGTNIMVCSSATTNCSPILPATAGCNTGTGCYYVGPEDRTACISVGTKAAGETCTFGNECVPGYICIGTTATDVVCRQMCRAGRDADCSGAQRCVTIQGSTLYGVCI